LALLPDGKRLESQSNLSSNIFLELHSCQPLIFFDRAIVDALLQSVEANRLISTEFDLQITLLSNQPFRPFLPIVESPQLIQHEHEHEITFFAPRFSHGWRQSHVSVREDPESYRRLNLESGYLNDVNKRLIEFEKVIECIGKPNIVGRRGFAFGNFKTFPCNRHRILLEYM
jgi:hypothetical protein